MKKKVFIGVGHGGKDSGAIKYVIEKELNLIMALACRDKLEEYGVEVKMSREEDENDPLTEEIRECNEYEPDLAIDIHNNAGGGDGFEVYHEANGLISKVLAINIEKEIIAIGQNSRGLKTRTLSNGQDYFGFLREINCPSVLVEGVFVDNIEDTKIVDTVAKQMEFGYAYARGILKTLGINPCENINKEEPEAKKSVLELAKEVLAGVWGNGATRKKKLEEAGYNYKEVQTMVNDILFGEPANIQKKTIDEIAKEVIKGKWGNGKSRKKKLEAAGYNYREVQDKVNEILS